MIAREAVLNDPSVAELLRTRFVCVAVDNVDHPQLTRSERAFLEDKGLKFSTQGMSVFTSGGQVLGMGGGFEPGPVREMLEAALAKFRPEEGLKIEAPARAADEPPADDPQSIRRPPEGGLVLYATWRVLWPDDRIEGSATTGDGTYDKTFQHALGIDRVWVRADEARQLAARAAVPKSLLKRITHHVSYTFAGKVGQSSVSVKPDGRLTGEFITDTGDRVAVDGAIEASGERITRLELLLTGPAERSVDFGFPASLTVIPADRKVPAALLFELADPADDLSRIPPARCRAHDYLE